MQDLYREKERDWDNSQPIGQLRQIGEEGEGRAQSLRIEGSTEVSIEVKGPAEHCITDVITTDQVWRAGPVAEGPAENCITDVVPKDQVCMAGPVAMWAPPCAPARIHLARRESGGEHYSLRNVRRRIPQSIFPAARRTQKVGRLMRIKTRRGYLVNPSR